MLPGNSTRLLLYGGLCGAAIIVLYGAVKLMPAHTVTVMPVIEQAPPPPVQRALIAKQLIHRGEVIKAADLDVLPIEGALPALVQVSPDGVIGKVAVTDIAPSQFVLSSEFSADPGKAGLAMLVPAGLRAIAFRTTDEVAVGNFIRPGDHVDLQLVLPEPVLPGGSDLAHRNDGSGSEAHTLLQDVTVLSVGDLITVSAEEAAATRKIDPPRAVTIALTPDQVSQFVLARSIGTIFLTLRNPTDPQSIEQNTATLKAIRGRTAISPVPVVEGKRPIELVTGSQTRTIYSISPGGK
jgi:pilus assembly protein CpaB